MLIEDLIKAIEDYLEVTPEKCKETTSPRRGKEELSCSVAGEESSADGA